MATTARLIAKLSLDDSQFRRNMMSAIKLSDTVGAKMTKIGSTAIVGGFVAAAGGAALLAVALKKVTDEAGDLQSSRASFEVMLGSVAKAKAMSASIIQMANATPFGAGGLSKNVQTMLAFGVANDRVLPSLKMLGDVAGADQEKLDLLTLAFSQTTAAGKLMGQDLLQYVNAGFSPLQEISRTTGRSMADLRKDMEAGAISAEMVARAFETATGAGGRFYGNMARQAKTWNGLLSNINSTWAMVLAGFGTPIIDKLSPMLEDFKDKLTTFSSFAPQIGQGLVDDISGAFKGKELTEAMADLAGKFVRIMTAAAKGLAKTIAAALLNGFADPLATLQATMQAMAYTVQNPFAVLGLADLGKNTQERDDLNKQSAALEKQYLALPANDRTAAAAAAKNMGDFSSGAVMSPGVKKAFDMRVNLKSLRARSADLQQKIDQLAGVDIDRIKKEILARGGPQLNYGAGDLTSDQILKEAGVSLEKDIKKELPKTAKATTKAIASVSGGGPATTNKTWNDHIIARQKQLSDLVWARGGKTMLNSDVSLKTVGLGSGWQTGSGPQGQRTPDDIAKTSRSIWRGSRLARERAEAASKNDMGQNIKRTAETLNTMSKDLGVISGRTGSGVN